MPDVLEMEQSLLGAMLTDYGTVASEWGRVSVMLEPRDFIQPQHALIFDAMLSVAADGDEINYQTVGAQLGDDLIDLGGYRYLCELGDRVLSYGASKRFAPKIKKAAKHRRAKQGMADAMMALNGGQPPADVLHNLQLLSDMTPDDEEKPKDLLAETFEQIAKVQDGSQAGQVNLGLINLNPYAPAPDELCVIAARPSVGKTALAVALAENLTTAGDKVLFVSAEMAAGAVVKRRVAMIAGVDQGKLKRKDGMTDGDYQRLADAFEQCKRRPIEVVDGMRKTTDIVAAIRRHARESGANRVFVDHLHLLKHPDADREDLRIGESTKAFAALCKDLNITIFLLAQLNRMVESREKKMPTLADLRSSGAIEEDADVVLFLRRKVSKTGVEEGFKIGCAKNRNGPLGFAELDFDPATGRFKDWMGGR